MVRKKNPIEKFPRVTITLNPALQAAVMERVRADGVTLSGLVSELLTTWLNGSVVLAESAQPQTPIYELETRIEALERSIQTSIHTDTYQYEQERIIDTNQYEPVHMENQDERIIITDETLQEIHARITALQADGMTIPTMAEIVGIPAGSLRRLAPGHNSPLKSISREQYDRLMKIPL